MGGNPTGCSGSGEQPVDGAPELRWGRGGALRELKEEWDERDGLTLKMTPDPLHSRIRGFLEGSKMM